MQNAQHVGRKVGQGTGRLEAKAHRMSSAAKREGGWGTTWRSCTRDGTSPQISAPYALRHDVDEGQQKPAAIPTGRGHTQRLWQHGHGALSRRRHRRGREPKNTCPLRAVQRVDERRWRLAQGQQARRADGAQQKQSLGQPTSRTDMAPEVVEAQVMQTKKQGGEQTQAEKTTWVEKSTARKLEARQNGRHWHLRWLNPHNIPIEGHFGAGQRFGKTTHRYEPRVLEPKPFASSAGRIALTLSRWHGYTRRCSAFPPVGLFRRKEY
jgi:hypothetical protein